MPRHSYPEILEELNIAKEKIDQTILFLNNLPKDQDLDKDFLHSLVIALYSIDAHTAVEYSTWLNITRNLYEQGYSDTANVTLNYIIVPKLKTDDNIYYELKMLWDFDRNFKPNKSKKWEVITDLLDKIADQEVPDYISGLWGTLDAFVKDNLEFYKKYIHGEYIGEMLHWYNRTV